MPEDYNKLTVKELKALAEENNIDIPSSARKAEIVKIIEESLSGTEAKGVPEGDIEDKKVDDKEDSQSEEDSGKLDYNNWKKAELVDFCKKNNIDFPSTAKKAEILEIVKEAISDPNFVDKSQEEEELEEELIAGFDEEEDPAFAYKQSTDSKFWQMPEYRVLLDYELAKDSEVAFYDLSNLVDRFFKNMLSEDMINYKISGIALKSAASLHHYKISSIIKEEEQIQKKEELEKLRERHQRSIPKALPQPIQPKLQIATKDELFGAMRSAIIETMQKKEKLKRRRIRREAEKEKRIKMRSKAKLPKELLKHISGKEQTIDELHNTWLNRIKATTNLNDKKETSFFELLELIKNDEESSIGRRFALVRLFLALMFLSTPGSSGLSKTLSEIELFQADEFKDINISLK